MIHIFMMERPRRLSFLEACNLMNVRNEYSTERVRDDGESDDEMDGANDENLSSDDGDMAMIEEGGSSSDSDSDSLVSQFEDCSEESGWRYKFTGRWHRVLSGAY